MMPHSGLTFAVDIRLMFTDLDLMRTPECNGAEALTLARFESERSNAVASRRTS
jgi:hypothetical protein